MKSIEEVELWVEFIDKSHFDQNKFRVKSFGQNFGMGENLSDSWIPGPLSCAPNSAPRQGADVNTGGVGRKHLF